MKRWVPWALAGVVVVGGAAAAVAMPGDFARSEWRKTYCQLCGATKEVVVDTWLWGAIESSEPKVRPAEPMGTWVGPHGHDWVKPPHIVFPDEDAQWSRERKLHDQRVELVFNHLWPDAFEPGGERVLRGLGAQGQDRAAEAWQALIDPDRFLPFSAVRIFGLEVSHDSQWALWQQLVESYECRDGYPVRCGLTAPAWMQLRELSVDRRSEVSIDWSRWTFGQPPPPFLFDVETYTPKDAAERERGRAVAERALSWLGAEDPASVPAAVKIEASGWSNTPDGRMTWSTTLHVDGEPGRLLLDARRGEDEFVARYESGEGGWRQRGEDRVPLEPNLHHGLERLLRSATTAQWLARALAEPDRAQLRALGETDVEGQLGERLLVTLAGRYVAELHIDEQGRVLAERSWQRTEHGMDMVTTVYDEWSTHDGIEVATKWRTRRDGADGVSSEAELESLEWGVTVPAEQAEQDAQAEQGAADGGEALAREGAL